MHSVQTSQQTIWQPLWQLPRRAELIVTLTKRELQSRYKGSMLGVVWTLITPIVMIAIFTFIFAGIFGARFGPQSSHWDYSIYLFCGLLPWTMFQETLQQSATTIVSHANLVKRVVFPLETLPVVQAFTALINQLIGTLVLLVAAVILQHRPSLSMLLLPVLLIPQMLLTLGAAWWLASMGVFIRDITQGIGLVLMAWMYVTPIIYPESLVPERYQTLINLNPMTGLVRNYRRILLEGAGFDWPALAYFSGVAVVVFIFGYWWFARSRKSFADVI